MMMASRPPRIFSACAFARSVMLPRPRHHLGQPLDRRAGFVHQHHERVHDLAQVVRRNVGRHADGDARRAIDEQVRNARRQDDGLLLVLVVVRDEVDGVLVDVGEQLVSDARHAGFGVAHGRRRIAVDRAEVPLAVDERIA
jgi:hypothetical protein